MKTTCHVTEVLLDCNCPWEGGEDGQHAQFQADVRAGQCTLAKSLWGSIQILLPFRLHTRATQEAVTASADSTCVFSLSQRCGAFLASSFRSLIASLFTAFLGSSFKYCRRSCSCEKRRAKKLVFAVVFVRLPLTLKCFHSMPKNPESLLVGELGQNRQEAYQALHKMRNFWKK